MIDFTVVEELDDPFHWQYDDWIYNQEAFQLINNDLPQFHYYLVDKSRSKVYGHVCFQLQEGKMISNSNAPFGGVSFADSITEQVQVFFMIEVERLLSSKSIRGIVLHQAPSINGSKELIERLSFLNYKQMRKREYQVLTINGVFEERVHDMELRKLRKAEEKSFHFDWARADEFKEVFEFILKQRSLLGYEFSLTWPEFKEYLKEFPEKYMAARVWDNGRLIAASILVREQLKMLYQFAPAHLKTYNRYSPVVFMTQQIFNWAKENDIDYLNLGTSYLGLERNSSLFAFKEKLGAKVFIAPSLQKMINS